MRRGAGAAVLALAVLTGCPSERGPARPDRGAARRPPPPDARSSASPRPRPAPGPARGFTFFVTADTHFGWPGMALANRRQVRAMNGLHARTFPAAVGGGLVGHPRGVLVAGDLTQDGTRAQWAEFTAVYGRNGRDGLLRYPTLEAPGNHDSHGGRRYVASMVRQRHGAQRYAWWWRGVRFICLGRFPKARYRRWLRRTLRAAGRETPVVIYFHYNMVGPYSFMWGRRPKRRFAADIRRYNVVAIFHGHYHPAFHYRWQGVDVFNVGAPKHGHHSFAVARVADGKLTVAYWDWSRGRWSMWRQKALRPASRAR